jgi:hypothetical protein
MDHFDPTHDDEIAALAGMIEQIRRGTAESEKALDNALVYCSTSEKRLNTLGAWMLEKGYDS